MTIKAIAAILPAFALLAACGETGDDAEIDFAAEEQTETAAEASDLPPPDLAVFSEVYAAACPEAQSVTAATCEAAGIGADSFTCEFSLGDGEDLGNEAVLEADGSSWMLANAETACSAGSE